MVVNKIQNQYLHSHIREGAKFHNLTPVIIFTSIAS